MLSRLGAVVAVIFAIGASATLPAATMRHALVFDAGSSGTRLHVFKWTPTQSADEIPRLALPQPTKKVKPGLSSFAQSPQTAGASLAPLFAFAEEHVPPELWKDTPVLLRATAGLRLLPADQSEAILHSCRGFIATTHFKCGIARARDFGPGVACSTDRAWPARPLDFGVAWMRRLDAHRLTACFRSSGTLPRTSS